MKLGNITLHGVLAFGLAGVAVFALAFGGAQAQLTAEDRSMWTTTPPAATVVPRPADVQPPAAAVLPPNTVSLPAAAPAPPVAAAVAAQNTITTTAPVTSKTTIDVGTLAGEVLMWVASAFATTIGGALTLLIMRILKNAGIQGNELLRAKLQDMIVNGLNAGAKGAAEHLQGRAQIEVKNAVVARAVTYVQDHGADTLKELGIDPASAVAVEAIKARIETAINDPAAPTPPVLDVPQSPKAAAAAAA